MPRSRPSNYKAEIRFQLIKRFKWAPKLASRFLRENREYLRAMYDSAAPPNDTAHTVNQMKESGLWPVN